MQPEEKLSIRKDENDADKQENKQIQSESRNG